MTSRRTAAISAAVITAATLGAIIGVSVDGDGRPAAALPTSMHPTTTSTTTTITTTTTSTTTTTTLPPPPSDLSPAVEANPDIVVLALFDVPATLDLRRDNAAGAGGSLGNVVVRLPKNSARISGLGLASGSGWTLDVTSVSANYVLTYSPTIPAGGSSSTAQLTFRFRPRNPAQHLHVHGVD